MTDRKEILTDFERYMAHFRVSNLRVGSDPARAYGLVKRKDLLKKSMIRAQVQNQSAKLPKRPEKEKNTTFERLKSLHFAAQAKKIPASPETPSPKAAPHASAGRKTHPAPPPQNAQQQLRQEPSRLQAAPRSAQTQAIAPKLRPTSTRSQGTTLAAPQPSRASAQELASPRLSKFSKLAYFFVHGFDLIFVLVSAMVLIIVISENVIISRHLATWILQLSIFQALAGLYVLYFIYLFVFRWVLGQTLSEGFFRQVFQKQA